LFLSLWLSAIKQWEDRVLRLSSVDFCRRPNSKSWSENDEVPRIEAYGQVFKTWSDWINNNIDPARTSVFFMTISSPHLRWPKAAAFIFPFSPSIWYKQWWFVEDFDWLVPLGVICNATLNFLDHCRFNWTGHHT
jgi:hypothetical protein